MTRLRDLRDEDAGLALPFALWVMILAVGLSVALVATVVFVSRTVGLGRDRVQSTSAAESGVDALLATMERSSSPSQLPCTMVGGAGTTAPHYQLSVSYFDSAGSPMAPCTGNYATDLGKTLAGTAVPAQALVTSHGWSALPGIAGQPNAGEQTFQALLAVKSAQGTAPTSGTSSSGTPFGRAIFGDKGIAMGQSSHLNGHNGNDANVFANGPISCGNSSYVQGGADINGDVTIANSCTVYGNLFATGKITITNPSVLVTGNVSSTTSSIAIKSPSKIVNGSAYAKSWICVGSGNGVLTNTGCQTTAAGIKNIVAGGTYPNNAAPPAPAAETLPNITFVASEWATKGWTVENVACASVPNRMRSVTVKTVIVATGCASPVTPPPSNPSVFGVELDNGGEIVLQTDVAVISPNGFYAKQSKIHANGSAKNLFLIVPANGTRTSACTANRSAYEDVYFKTSNEVDAPVQSFIYTPCSVSYNQSPHYEGQIYAGKFTAGQSFEMKFIPMTVPGIGGGGTPTSGTTTTGAAGFYTVDVMYRREVPTT